MSLAATLSAPYFTGASRALDVPHRFHCSLAGRPFMIDTARLEEFTRRAIPITRQQADTSESPGEASLSVEELWRRSQDDWTHGAGQTYLDRRESNNRRFRSSKGIDVWTRWQMSLLPATKARRASANTGLTALPVGEYVYALDGAELIRTTTLATWTAITGLPATAPSSLVTDGFNIWTAHGTSGVYSITRGGGAPASQFNTVNATLLGFVKGRLMAAFGSTLYNIIDSTVPAALFTQRNSDFKWVGFAEGQSVIYAAGYSGDKSLIYRIGIKQDGTGLDAPLIAGALPDGEVVRSIYGYLGFVLLGTDKGVRFCASDEQGNLTIGAVIETSAAVRCFEGQDRFVWFGWTNYDGTSTGLGRLDLSTFVAPLTPAYASDLMVTGQGRVSSVSTFNDRLVLTVDGLGFYSESTADLVASGTLDTGLITYGLPDRKTAVYLDVKVSEPVDTNRAYVSVDRGPFVMVGTRSSAQTDPFTVGELSGETFEVRHELLNADATVTTGPTVTRYTLRAYPRPTQGEVFTVPVLLHESVMTVNEQAYPQRPDEEFDFITRLRENKQLVTFQLGSASHTVMVDDALFAYSHPTTDGKAWNGTALLRLKSPAS